MTAAPVRRRRARPLRRRAPGRAVRLALVLLVAGGGLRLVAGGESAVALSAPQSRVVVVEQGQTLWSLAREVAPEADPRVVVERLRAANGLEGAGLAIGQRLLVPVQG